MPKISVLTPSIRPEGLKIVHECLKNQTFTDFEWLTEIGLGKKHDLNAAMNKMIKRAQGEIIVFYQDYIKVPNRFLETVAKSVVDTACTTYPVGKVIFPDFAGEPEWDWREHKTGAISWQEWEIDLASIKREALFVVGGFDEELDKYWSFDNVNLAFRLNEAGYKFYNSKSDATFGIAFDHDVFIDHPFRKNYNPDFHNQRLDEFRMGLKIDYLK